jgi:hypothetical protein
LAKVAQVSDVALGTLFHIFEHVQTIWNAKCYSCTYLIITTSEMILSFFSEKPFLYTTGNIIHFVIYTSALCTKGLGKRVAKTKYFSKKMRSPWAATP